MSRPIPHAVREQAAEWLLTLQAEAGDAGVMARWQQWLIASDDHRRAWTQVEAFATRLQGLPSPLAHATLAAPASLQRRQAVKTLALLVFAGGAAVVVEQRTPWRRWMADRQTGTGERAAATLDDGTRVELNAGTAIDIRFSDGERRLRLVDGEILITTARDPLAAAGQDARPFIVETGQGAIRALGTRFSVRRFDGATPESRVAVYEGAVELRPRGGGLQRLDAGQQSAFTGTAIGPVMPADENATAWVRGMIVAQEMSLADFLAELGRHRPGHLGCDPALAALPVTGTYPLADTDKVLDMLQVTLPVRLHMRTRYWVRLVPKAQV